MDAFALRQMAAEAERLEKGLVRLSASFDDYLNYTEQGALPATEAEPARQRLCNAIRALLGYAEEDYAQAWTREDNQRAMSEGWLIADVDGTGDLEIQRLDDPQAAFYNADKGRHELRARPVFRNDAEALAYVRMRAATGSEFHRRALAVIRTDGNAD